VREHARSRLPATGIVPPVGRRVRPPDAALRLQRAVGNRRVGYLLQRAPAAPELVRDLGATNPKDWTPATTRSGTDLLAEIATLAQVDRVLTGKDAGDGKVNVVAMTEVGKKDIKPGLNFSKAPPHGYPAETGFVDADGTYTGMQMPVTADGGLPAIAVILAPTAFDGGKARALAVLRHEMEHVRHFKALRERLMRWRAAIARGGKLPSAADARKRYDAWKDTAGSRIDAALAEDERKGVTFNTELLAYVEGFMTVFHLQPAGKPEFPAFVPGPPPAIFQLASAARRYPLAADPVQAQAEARLRAYCHDVLTPDQRAMLRQWVAFALAAYSPKPPPPTKGVADIEGQARSRIYDDFYKGSDGRPFLKKVLEIASKDDAATAKRAQALVKEARSGHRADVVKKIAALSENDRAALVSAASLLGDDDAALIRRYVELVRHPSPAEALHKVDVIGAGKLELTDTVEGGKVELRSGAHIKYESGDERDQAISMTYDGAEPSDSRWLQFISREIVVERKGGRSEPQPGIIARNEGDYGLTTDPKARIWNTDTGTRETAFYEIAANREAGAAGKGQITVFDQPDNRGYLARPAFANKTDPPTRVTSRVKLVLYLVREADVLYRIDLDFETDISGPDDLTPPRLVLPVKRHGKASALDPEHKARMGGQFRRKDVAPVFLP
jgi:hypothetical protein